MPRGAGSLAAPATMPLALDRLRLGGRAWRPRLRIGLSLRSPDREAQNELADLAARRPPPIEDTKRIAHWGGHASRPSNRRSRRIFGGEPRCVGVKEGDVYLGRTVNRGACSLIAGFASLNVFLDTRTTGDQSVQGDIRGRKCSASARGIQAVSEP